MHHIPSDEYYFDPSLADTPPTPEPEEIPEEEEEEDQEMGVEGDSSPKGKAKATEEKVVKEVVQFSTGRWRSRVTGRILGEDDEKVKFTVIE